MSMMENIQKLPKWVIVVAGVAFVALMGWGMVTFAFGGKDKGGTEGSAKSSGNQVTEFPDAAEDNKTYSKLEELNKASRGSSNANDYWNSLGGGSAEEGGLVSSAHAAGGAKGDGYLDPKVYSELEIYYIQRGIRTKEEVDRKHAERKAEEEEDMRRRQEEEKERSVDQESLYFARMERAYQLAQKYSQEPDKPAEPEKSVEPEPRKIDVEQKSIPSTTLVDDGIITSLESGSMSGGINHVDGQVVVTPVKATFLKSETVVSGQRVIMRLIQDLRLSDGTLIPANTHVSGICTIGSRLQIKISTVNYGGRIYYTDIDIYDADGTEGIYCPVIVDSKNGKKIGKQVAQIATQVAGTVASMSSPYAGMLARTGADELMSLTIDAQGNKSVKVSAGYEFFMFENTEKEKKK